VGFLRRSPFGRTHGTLAPLQNKKRKNKFYNKQLASSKYEAIKREHKTLFFNPKKVRIKKIVFKLITLDYELANYKVPSKCIILRIINTRILFMVQL
jgi:hypothetical protein